MPGPGERASERAGSRHASSVANEPFSTFVDGYGTDSINQDVQALLWTRPNCYPNCDAGTVPPVLNVADFVCFLNKFAAGCS
ncbi:MAG: hypothetical protein ACKVW3_08000 [Phycisphaerales bacterium]